MKSLDIKYISAKNFLCFGTEDFEIDFSKYGNIVLVKGSNFDVLGEDSRYSSNGVGKSSIPEIIVYTLFGKTIKNPKKIKHKDVINNQIGKNLRTEVRWGDFRVVRTKKPDSLRMWESKDGKWEDDTEISLGGQPATQKLIEEKLGLNYETFVNVVVFTDNNSGSFLECDASNKREIVENLLSLEKYKSFAEKAKELKKEKKDIIKLTQNEYENLRINIENAKKRIEEIKKQNLDWENQKKEEIKTILSKIKIIKKEISSSSDDVSFDEYNQAQDEIEKLNTEIPKLENKQIKIQELLEKAQEKLNNIKTKKSECEIKISSFEEKKQLINTKIAENTKKIQNLENNEGDICKTCFAKISKNNYKKYTENLLLEIKDLEKEKDSTEISVDKNKQKIKEYNSLFEEIKIAISSTKTNLISISDQLKKYRNKIFELNKISKPQNKSVEIQLLEQKIENLKEQANIKKKELEGENPFNKIIKTTEEEIKDRLEEFSNKNEQLNSLEKELPYYEFWSIAFGDSGIRKFIIDGIIPALNSKVEYWMQFLIDGKIKLQFNNELEEKIERNPSDGDPFVYYAMSGGERRRLNLAVSQAFAYVMMLNSGMCPNLVFLDEVTTNIDQIGVVGVYNMIVELAKDRQVFITTHDQNLLDMLEGCELINLEKRNGLTSLKKK